MNKIINSRKSCSFFKKQTGCLLVLFVILLASFVPSRIMASINDISDLYQTNYNSSNYIAYKVEVTKESLTKTVKGYVFPMVADPLEYGDAFLRVHDIVVELRADFITPAQTYLSTKAVLVNSSGLGEFTFEHVLPGSYLLYIKRPGYLTRCLPVVITDSSPSIILLEPPGLADAGIFNLWAGDINDDNRVDSVDIALISGVIVSGFDTYPVYDSACDLNGDGEVDSNDIIIAVNNLAQTARHYSGAATVNFTPTSTPSIPDKPDDVTINIYHHYENDGVIVNETQTIDIGNYPIDSLFSKTSGSASVEIYELIVGTIENNSVNFNWHEAFTLHIYYKKALTVTFLLNDETGDIYDSISIIYPETTANSKMPNKPTRSGYVFLQWNTEEGGTGMVVDKETIINSDLVLYAQWEVIQNPNTKDLKTYPFAMLMIAICGIVIYTKQARKQ